MKTTDKKPVSAGGCLDKTVNLWGKLCTLQVVSEALVHTDTPWLHPSPSVLSLTGQNLRTNFFSASAP